MNEFLANCNDHPDEKGIEMISAMLIAIAASFDCNDIQTKRELKLAFALHQRSGFLIAVTIPTKRELKQCTDHLRGLFCLTIAMTIPTKRELKLHFCSASSGMTRSTLQ